MIGGRNDKSMEGAVSQSRRPWAYPMASPTRIRNPGRGSRVRAMGFRTSYTRGGHIPWPWQGLPYSDFQYESRRPWDYPMASPTQSPPLHGCVQIAVYGHPWPPLLGFGIRVAEGLGFGGSDSTPPGPAQAKTDAWGECQGQGLQCWQNQAEEGFAQYINMCQYINTSI